MLMSNAAEILSVMFEKNLPPTQAAKVAGVTFDTLIRAISGDVRIRFDTAAKFRRIFGDEAVRVVKRGGKK